MLLLLNFLALFRSVRRRAERHAQASDAGMTQLGQIVLIVVIVVLALIGILALAGVHIG